MTPDAAGKGTNRENMMTAKISISGAIAAGLLAAGLMTGSALAQQKAPANPCATDPHFRDFDFWVGTWDVTDRKNGQAAGTNTITLTDAGCALEERWVSKGGRTGMSINFYNPVRGKWRQVWISEGQYSINIEGGLDKEGAMVLEGKIFIYSKGIALPFRGTWTPQEDGTVRQYFQQFDPKTEKWNDWFDGLYTRQGPIE